MFGARGTPPIKLCSTVSWIQVPLKQIISKPYHSDESKQQRLREKKNHSTPLKSASLLPHFLVKPTDEGLRCTSISTAFPPVTYSHTKLSVSWYLPEKKLWLFAPADTPRCECERTAWDGNSRNFRSLIWAIRIPAKHAGIGAKVLSETHSSTLNSIHTSFHWCFLPALHGECTLCPFLEFSVPGTTKRVPSLAKRKKITVWIVI